MDTPTILYSAAQKLAQSSSIISECVCVSASMCVCTIAHVCVFVRLCVRTYIIVSVDVHLPAYVCVSLYVHTSKLAIIFIQAKFKVFFPLQMLVYSCTSITCQPGG